MKRTFVAAMALLAGLACALAFSSVSTATVRPAGTTGTAAATGTTRASGTTTTGGTSTRATPKVHHPQLDIPIAFYWAYRTKFTYLEKIRFGRLPSDLLWVAKFTRVLQPSQPELFRAPTAATRRVLLRALEHIGYTSGQTLKLVISRPHYKPQYVVFRIRYHNVPVITSHSPTLTKKTAQPVTSGPGTTTTGSVTLTT